MPLSYNARLGLKLFGFGLVLLLDLLPLFGFVLYVGASVVVKV